MYNILYTYLQRAKFTTVPQWRTCCFRYEFYFQFFKLKWREKSENTFLCEWWTCVKGNRCFLNYSRGFRGTVLVHMLWSGLHVISAGFLVRKSLSSPSPLMNSHVISLESVTLWNRIWIYYIYYKLRKNKQVSWLNCASHGFLPRGERSGLIQSVIFQGWKWTSHILLPVWNVFCFLTLSFMNQVLLFENTFVYCLHIFVDKFWQTQQCSSWIEGPVRDIWWALHACYWLWHAHPHYGVWVYRFLPTLYWILQIK